MLEDTAVLVKKLEHESKKGSQHSDLDLSGLLMTKKNSWRSRQRSPLPVARL